MTRTSAPIGNRTMWRRYAWLLVLQAVVLIVALGFCCENVGQPRTIGEGMSRQEVEQILGPEFTQCPSQIPSPVWGYYEQCDVWGSEYEFIVHYKDGKVSHWDKTVLQADWTKRSRRPDWVNRILVPIGW